jgi:hypothetical protein
MPRRIMRLVDLISDITAGAVALGIADRKGLTVARGDYYTGLYLRIVAAEASLCIDHAKWSRYGISPLWISFSATAKFGRAPFVLQALKSWAPPRLFQENGSALVPLTILPDVTRDRVRDDLLEQLTRLHAALQSAAAMTATPSQQNSGPELTLGTRV